MTRYKLAEPPLNRRIAAKAVEFTAIDSYTALLQIRTLI